MPEFDFILNKDEQVEFMQFALSNGCQLIPGIHYDNSNYLVLKTIESFLLHFESSKFHLINEKYTLFPIEMRSFEKGGERVFYINERYGGPAIDFYSPNLIEGEKGLIGPGFIAFYPSYYTGKAKISAPDDLKSIYKLFVSFIKKRSKKISLTKRTFWIGNNTIELVKSGKRTLVSIGDFDLTEIAKGL